MIVLDTNIVSEPLNLVPSPVVMAWLDSLDTAATFTTSITQAEMLWGIAKMPAGRRKDLIAATVENTFVGEFQSRILPFDEHAAPAYAAIMAERMRTGRPISQSDAMIAAICRSRGATIATRNVADFENCGITVVNPFTEPRT